MSQQITFADFRYRTNDACYANSTPIEVDRVETAKTIFIWMWLETQVYFLERDSSYQSIKKTGLALAGEVNKIENVLRNSR